MKDYLIKDEWKIIEVGYKDQFNKISESVCSIGNGHMGQRATFEEGFSGPTHQGSYLGGVYYPDKTKVGWWKNGYPEYFAKVLNSVNWIGLRIELEDEEVDIHKAQEIQYFRRELDMKKGVLTREVKFISEKGRLMSIRSERFISMADKELGALEYRFSIEGYQGKIKVHSYLDFDVTNQDANYDENFWEQGKEVLLDGDILSVSAVTKKTNFTCVAHMADNLISTGMSQLPEVSKEVREKYGAHIYTLDVAESRGGFTLTKLVNLSTSRNHNLDRIDDHNLSEIQKHKYIGYEELLANHISAWAKKWDEADIVISGDVSAQQAIRFNIFHLNQTYTGEDDRLNIGPKGFTGEKYGGSTYWDTEAYCLPFYLATAPQAVARNLLIYRYKHLGKAIENAEKLGFSDGAALYPMVTMTGEECHNEWEITFEEIHRNGAIAYAIYDYVRYTGDSNYLQDYGLEVLIAIARFWRQRVNFSHNKNQYVILGVTGPNEYENNVDNNWYTNYIARWCLKYTMEIMNTIQNENPSALKEIKNKVALKKDELEKWGEIMNNMYLPFDEEQGVFLQQDNYLDKEQFLVEDLDDKHKPLNQNWSWDRILRSCFIKQADVLQGIYFFQEDFSLEEIRRNFNFYEPRTVHESSLSPCVHAILACKLGMKEKAYEMYLRTARLDLDDYNNDTEDGCHITSMAGTWMSIVKGFAGQEIKNGHLHFNPMLPDSWDGYGFKISHRGITLQVSVTTESIQVANLSDKSIQFSLGKEHKNLGPKEKADYPTAYSMA